MNNVEIELTLFLSLLEKCKKESIGLAFENYWAKQMPIGKNDLRNKTIKRLPIEKNVTIDFYKNIDITYSFNKFGYRQYNINELKDKIFCFGCSFTMGHGLPDNHTWPFLLGEKLNMAPVNYGVGGISSNYIARSLYQIINTISEEDYPKHIFILFPNFFRKEVLINDNEELDYIRFCIGGGSNHTKDSVKLNYPSIKSKHIDAYFNSHSIIKCFFDFVYDFQFINNLLESKNISWSWSSWASIFNILTEEDINFYLKNNTVLENNKLKNFKYKDYTPSRDGTHRGLDYMQDVSKLFYDTYINQQNQKLS